jgi:hypothetical protein
LCPPLQKILSVPLLSILYAASVKFMYNISSSIMVV